MKLNYRLHGSTRIMRRNFNRAHLSLFGNNAAVASHLYQIYRYPALFVSRALRGGNFFPVLRQALPAKRACSLVCKMMKNHPVKKRPHLRFGIIPFIFISMLPPPTLIVNTNFLTTSVITDKMDICPFCSSIDSGNIYLKSADFLYSPAAKQGYPLFARESRFFRYSIFSELFSNYLRLIYYLK